MTTEDFENSEGIEFRPYRFLKRKLDYGEFPFTQEIDKKGVPFLLVNDDVYVCWTASRHSQAFKIEWPYSGNLENKIRCKTEELVIRKLMELIK